MAPPGPVKLTCAGVKVAGLISSLKVSCTELRGELLDHWPMGLAETTYAPFGLATAAAAFRRPPVVTLPTRLGSAVVWSRIASMTWLIDQLGWAASTRATVPVTNGAAIEVPLR